MVVAEGLIGPGLGLQVPSEMLKTEVALAKMRPFTGRIASVVMVRKGVAVPGTIGAYWPYAATIFDFTRRSMPLPNQGGVDR